MDRFGFSGADAERLKVAVSAINALPEHFQLKLKEAVESASCWFVPCFQIGTIGYAIRKSDSRVFAIGSAYSFELTLELLQGGDWAAFDAGMLT